MNSIEKTVIAKAGQPLKAVRAPAKSGLLSVVRGKDERSLHLSPILQQIKDDGPALIDGEVVKDAAAPKLAKPAAALAASTTAAAVAAPHTVLSGKHVNILMGFSVALLLGLCASLYVSWQQQQRLAKVEYLLETLVITTSR